MRTLAALVAVVALVSSPVLAQDHEHEGAADDVLVTHDAGPDGLTYVGNLNHFGWVLPDEATHIAFHNNAVVRISLNGALLYETTPSSGHDYDGLHPVAITFPVPGTYTVEVTIPGDEGDLVGTFSGTVLPAPEGTARIVLDAPDEATAWSPLTLTYEVQDEMGALLTHSDAVLQVVHPAFGEVYRLQTHTHDAAQEVTLALPGPARYDVQLTAFKAFPSKEGRAFSTVVATHAIEVHEGAPLGVPMPPTEVPLTNRAEATSGDGSYQLVATYDPYTAVAPWNPIRLGVAVLDPAGLPVPHVDMEAGLLDPFGNVLLASTTLHEYDGVFEFVGAWPVPGDYRLEVTATRDDWRETIVHRFSVLPPVAPTAAGPQFVELDGPDPPAAGEPSEFEFFLHDAAGVPFMHGEVALTVRDATGVPVLVDKLHTHGDGRFPFTLAFPEEGTYTIEADPLHTVPAPTPLFLASDLGPPLFTVSVAEGPGIPAAPVPEDLDTLEEEGEEVPLGAVLAVLGLALAARVARRA